jgi:chromosome segregation ATPase
MSETPMTPERLAEIAEELATTKDWSPGTRAAHDLHAELAAVRADRDQAQDRITELEEQRDRRRARLVALQNDALNMRGVLSPNGEKRKVPFPLGETLTPAVEWLIARVAELEENLRAVNARWGVARARVAELETAPTTIYRAEHPDSGITLGHYGIAEMTITVGDNELPTGYVVTALEIPSEYAEGADE